MPPGVWDGIQPSLAQCLRNMFFFLDTKSFFFLVGGGLNG